MSKKNDNGVCFRTSIGGQALMEGILMRGPDRQAIVCRTAEGLTEKVEPIKPLKERCALFGWPIIRGVAVFADSMLKGMKALTYSASLLPEDEQEEPDKFDMWLEKKLGSEKAEKAVIGIAAVLGVVLAVALFIILPTFIIGLIPGLEGHYTLRNLLEGVLKLAILLVYLYLCSNMKDMKRLFSYHGAEHKTIFCYEKGLPLTVENVRPQSRFHPRCGTSFLLVAIIVGILVGMLIQLDNTLLRMACRLALLPLTVGISYEINRWAGRHDNALSSFLSWPGRQLQHLTTKEPDDGMMECAIRAMELVIPEQKGADAW